ncbi:HtaA domain-containing protein [Streptomyces sp. A3M-1-3]|uniref:HtaA domain-containing protein n=1 Tax=Streptomyces sp. A3M-1-3 TaxID=2962044 RepID=UPI0020B6FDFB|nr:HtaA domain-containing protein [Streptomyces sp. A3M-1-3]MCP3817552.1 HtaA domain-containing protein [Streptomyces sp. A3M-1-3]
MPSFRPARVCAVALVAVLLGAFVPAAHAGGRTVQGGRLDWGIKSSFQSYVTGPVAKGSWRLRGGAATAGGSQFRFHSATGSYDPDSGAFRAGFSGGVRFVGHRKPDGSYELDLTISRPTVRISGGSGTLYADVVSRSTASSQVALASLSLAGVNMRGGGTPVVLTGVPATLTSQGAAAFAGYYAAGTQLDPVSLSADVVASATRKPVEKEGTDGTASGDIVDAAVDWGVRRTFREYVTGSIARGKWTLSAGAQDGGALFRFPRGEGTYDGRKGILAGAFAGTVRFTGRHLDLALSKVEVRVKGGRGTLSADVTRQGATQEAVSLVTFDAKGLRASAGLVTLTEAPTTLTPQGAKAFDDMYTAGTEMDPVSLAVVLDRKARLPALPDLGSQTSAPPLATPTPGARNATAVATSPSSDTGTYVAIGAGVLVAVAAVLLVVRKRRMSGLN